MDIIIGLAPAMAWGIVPVIISKIGGEPINQIIGTSLGACIMGMITFLIYHPEMTGQIFLFSFISGAFWSFGQMLQYTAYKQASVSNVIPISAGMQLIGVSLLGVFVFGEWAGTAAKLIGFSAIGLIIAGVICTTYKEIKDSTENNNIKRVVSTLLLSTIGYVGYSGFPKLIQADAWTEFFPQTLGMLSGSIIFSLIMTKGAALRERKSYQNVVSGFVFAVGALVYLFSIGLNGIVIGFALSQMNLVLATLGGIFILGEKKTKKEFMVVLLGLAIVVWGGLLITFA